MGLLDIIKNNKLETDAWMTLEVVDSPASDVIMSNVERPFEEPSKARSIRDRYFMQELEATEKRLEDEALRRGKSIELFIGDYDGAALNGIPKALFMKSDDGNKRLNFDGTTTNFSGIRREGSSVVIEVYPIAFSEWIACKTSEFANAYKDSVGRIPYAGIGISTVVESADRFFVLTQRGTGTPNYPGTLFTLGGGLKPEDNVGQGLLSEIIEESGLKPGSDYNPDDIIVTAIGAEKSYAGSEHQRPEIVAYLKTKVPWRKIVESQQKTAFQPDVSGLVPLDTEPTNFASRVAMMGSTGELLPAAEIGLVYAWLKKREIEVGVQQTITDAQVLIEMLNQYTRQNYKIPKLKNG